MKKDNKQYTVEDIEKIGNSVVGKKIKDLGDFKYDLEDFDYKGGIGVLMEENVFEYGANNKSKPDFEKAGVELKSTPVKRNKNGTYSAKERLVLNIINYMTEYKKTFQTSSFYTKNNKLFIMFYLWEDKLPKSEYTILSNILYEFPEEDLEIIKQDWHNIIHKIKEGKAHEISEADTLYLGACTKGRNNQDLTRQPFSDILAMRRAFCLKNSYMTFLVRSKVMNDKVESIINKSKLGNTTFERLIYDKVKRYIGKTVEELVNIFNLNSASKNVNERIFASMLNINGKVNDCEEFQKANIKCKTIRVKCNGTIQESMSFPAFKFTEIVNEEWETSNLRESFSEFKYVFVLFNEIEKNYRFSGFILWNMPLSILDKQIKDVWNETVNVIKSGNIIKKYKVQSNGKTLISNNFPKITFNGLCHVRPHARTSSDTNPLPIRDKLTGISEYTKQCFWLNSSYIKSIIRVNKNYNTLNSN